MKTTLNPIVLYSTKSVQFTTLITITMKFITKNPNKALKKKKKNQNREWLEFRTLPSGLVSERNCDALRSFSIWLADRDPWCRRWVRVSEAADFGYDSNLPGRCAVGLTRWSRSHGNEMLYECESRESQKEWNLRERVLVFGFWICLFFIFMMVFDEKVSVGEFWGFKFWLTWRFYYAPF